jgi:hypothetical protein
MGFDPRFPSRRRAGFHGSGLSVPEKAVYKKGVSYFVLGIAVVTGAASACGQTTSEFRALVRCSDNAAAYSRCLPWSGVLETEPTIGRRAITTPPSKTIQKVQTAKRETPVTMRHHVAHRHRPARDDRAHYDR